MSPLEIKMILHIYAIVADYRDQEDMAHAKSQAVRETFASFESLGLIEKRFSDEAWEATPSPLRASQFGITEKGEALVDALCAVKIPVIKWVQP